jgi:hypothetical protein
MNDIRTNRDLYTAVAELCASQRDSPRDLEEYLRALWALGSALRERPALSLVEFFGFLRAAFTATVPPFDKRWPYLYGNASDSLSGFAAWEAFILRQVVDLREMAESGTLAEELRYFGVNSPRGQRWYNFDPCTFLECATAGSFGGWEEGDDTDRDYVPGPVLAVGEDGQLRESDPRDLDRPVAPIDSVSWEDFRFFLGQGQWYE